MASQYDISAIRPVEPCDEMQEGAFATAALAKQGGRAAVVELEVDTFEDTDIAVGLMERLGQSDQLQHDDSRVYLIICRCTLTIIGCLVERQVSAYCVRDS